LLPPALEPLSAVPVPSPVELPPKLSPASTLAAFCVRMPAAELPLTLLFSIKATPPSISTPTVFEVNEDGLLMIVALASEPLTLTPAEPAAPVP